jgi:protein involved in polysaccharide export with SLBB domain
LIQTVRTIFHRGIWLIGLLALATVHLTGWAQNLPSMTGKPSSAETDLMQLFGGVSVPETPQGVFFEGPIDSNEYIVGPGDRLKLYFWQPRYAEYPVTVTGEGNVAIPMVGMVSVGNATLAEARRRIESAVATALRIGKVTVDLSEPRRFRVHVTGQVRIPGTYVVPATSRAADAILMAGGLKIGVQFVSGDTVVTYNGSLRRILLRDPSGTERHADLLSFLRGGRTDRNPLLRDGETIFVPQRLRTSSQIGVFGAVYQGGLFEHADGDELGDALILAGGLTPMADSSSLLVVGMNGLETHLDLRANTAAALTRPMNPGDRVYIGSSPDTSQYGSVTVTGEVTRPGGYSIRNNETTLREIIERAGGLLPTAAANSARLIRQVDVDPVAPERARLATAMMSQTPVLPYPADPGLAAEFSRWMYGTSVVNLEAAMKPGSADGNLKLRDGDSLEVPKGPLGVRVLGAVNAAGEVEWKPDKNLNYYLAQADGLNKAGWKTRTVVVKARNGSQLRYQTGLPIDPGDVIYVPLKPSGQTNWDIFKDIIAVTAQVATVILVVRSIGK